jgi:hypothetical protein
LIRGLEKGDIEFRFVHNDREVFVVVALKRPGNWDYDYVQDIYLPSIKWKVVLIPSLVAKTHADALSKLNLSSYEAVSAYFNLKD